MVVEFPAAQYRWYSENIPMQSHTGTPAARFMTIQTTSAVEGSGWGREIKVLDHASYVSVNNRHLTEAHVVKALILARMITR